jgi:hypothetical protein
MVWPAFKDLEVELWWHRGSLGGSRQCPYTLCIYHREVRLGSPILNALNELASDSPPAQCRLTFAPNQRKKSLRTLKLDFVSQRCDLRVMNIRREEQTAVIELTTIGLSLLIESVELWLAGGEDFGVAPGQVRKPRDLKGPGFGDLDRASAELWFWGPTYLAP